MPRPRNFRRICQKPAATYYKPRGIPLSILEHVNLTFDELEAIRLADIEGMYQEKAAGKMNISRQTFGRIIESAHRKIADALVNSDKVDFDLLPRCTGTTPDSPCHLMLDDATHHCRVCRQYEEQGEVEIKQGVDDVAPVSVEPPVAVVGTIRDCLAKLGLTVHVDGGSGDLLVVDKSEAVDDD